MLSPDQARDRAFDLVERARRAGAEAADAVYGASSSEGIQVRLGKLEDVERSESEHIALRVFIGQRSASIGSSDLSPAALDELAARAIDMARAAPEDAFAGLAPQDRLTRGPFPHLDLIDTHEPSPEALREAALEAEDSARALKGITNSDGATASFGHGVFALATSHGFAGAHGSTSHSLSTSVVSGDGAEKQRDNAWRSAHHYADLPSPADIGRLAGERAVAKLGSGKMKGGVLPVIFDPRVSGSIVGHLLGAITGNAIARRSSFLLDKLDEQIFAPGVLVVDDPHMPRGLRSRPFDGEGLATSARNIIEDGRLTGWLLDSASARQLNLAPTGHAARNGGGAPGISASNVHLAAGTATPAELMAGIADGVYVTELIGQGVNGVTGDYSRGAAGFRIVNGELAGPIAEFTIAGNLLRMFRELTPANDLEWHRAVNVPTLRIDGMTVAGD
ncbi:TldD/PmbA family protein [Novosphingobium panipatense]|uniref:Microcin-processing peptidase 1 n=1 Tax=Novosphingobium panipatense TaxID=428991 RepID=A0ABY1QBT6_9SPHN|nr:TldD/PmbA family protein [Novosphingobium panipatense]SMP62082.1 microcin-processing peptidase 1. Unknown type peptidase. MEROPS family U62 [Novosphingobium panipatense]